MRVIEGAAVRVWLSVVTVAVLGLVGWNVALQVQLVEAREALEDVEYEASRQDRDVRLLRAAVTDGGAGDELAEGLDEVRACIAYLRDVVYGYDEHEPWRERMACPWYAIGTDEADPLDVGG